jgi:membrane protein
MAGDFSAAWANSLREFSRIGIWKHAAALALCMLLSLPSLLLITVWVASHAFPSDLLQEAVMIGLSAVIGVDEVEELAAMLGTLDIPELTWWSAAVSLVVLLMTASLFLVVGRRAVTELLSQSDVSSDSLHARKRKDWIVAAGLVLLIVLLWSASLIPNAMLAAIGFLLEKWLGAPPWLVLFEYTLLQLAAIILLDWILYTHLPEQRLEFRAAGFGAALSVGLFLPGHYLTYTLIVRFEPVTLFDAAVIFLVLMFWLFYTALAFLMGAVFASELTQLRVHTDDSRQSNNGGQ